MLSVVRTSPTGIANTWTAQQTFSNPIRAADGAAAAPAYSFTNNTGMGIYLQGSSLAFQAANSNGSRVRLAANVFAPFFSGDSASIDLGATDRTWRDFFMSRNAFMTGLPTADPGVAGQLWNNSNVLNVSAGP